MAANSFGEVFCVTTFGESHGEAIGAIIDGFPAGLTIEEEMLQYEMQRRRPGQSKLTTRRDENDKVEILSGVFEGKTTGTPIMLLIRNTDQRPADYDSLKDVYRPSHADFTWQQKYGFRDYRGGGRSSARETAARVAAGAFAKMLLKQQGVSISAYVSRVADIAVEKPYDQLDLSATERSITRCPEPEKAIEMESAIEAARKSGDSLGGIVTCVVKGCPSGLGEPVFNKFHARLAFAMMGINAARGFEIGSGFSSALLKGSQHNDAFVNKQGNIRTETNNAGGVLGGISNGEDIYFNVAFKPVATIAKEQETVDMEGNEVAFRGRGRHDPCVLPRAVPIVEAMAALVLADFTLLARVDKL